MLGPIDIVVERFQRTRYCSRPVVAAKGATDADINRTKDLLLMLTEGETDMDKLKDVAKYPKTYSIYEGPLSQPSIHVSDKKSVKMQNVGIVRSWHLSECLCMSSNSCTGCQFRSIKMMRNLKNFKQYMGRRRLMETDLA